MTIQVISNAAPVAGSEPAVKDAEETKSAQAAIAASETESSESDAEETEAKEAEADESEAEESEEEAEAKGEADEGPKKKSGAQRRKERAERDRAEIERLNRLVETLAGKNAGEKQPNKAETKAAALTEKPHPDNFDTHAEYVEALTDWKTDQKLAERDQKAERAKLIAEQEKVKNTYAERVKAFSAEVRDYDEAIAEIDDVVFSPAAIDAITSSEVGPQIAYELAKNRAEAERIAKLPPGAAYKAIGKLEAQLEAKASKPKPETKTVTKAPKPLAPVGGSGKASTITTLEEAASRSQAEYEAFRRKQMKAKAAF